MVTWSNETRAAAGIAADHMRFVYEMGYLRGHGAGLLVAVGTLLGGEPLAGVDHTSAQARFAAREFVGRWARETDGEAGPIAEDRRLLVYEMGYLRGYGAGLLTSIELSQRTREDNADAK